MKSITKNVHHVIKRLGLDSFIADVGAHNTFANKLLPLPIEYEFGTRRKIKRDGAFFNVDVSDYMQWCLFANQPDRSWKFAADELTMGAIILDVGANVGQFCLKVAKFAVQQKLDATIYAFEPNPSTFNLLEQNLNLNAELQSSVQLNRLAAGDENATLNFSYDPSNSGGGSISKSATDLQVDVVALDDWFKKIQLSRVDFMKIDVEGYEPRVLIGATEIISRFRPVLYLEITDEWFKKIDYSSAWVFQRLEESGYELFVDGVHQLEKLSTSGIRARQFNILAIQKERV